MKNFKTIIYTVAYRFFFLYGRFSHTAFQDASLETEKQQDTSPGSS